MDVYDLIRSVMDKHELGVFQETRNVRDAVLALAFEKAYPYNIPHYGLRRPLAHAALRLVNEPIEMGISQELAAKMGDTDLVKISEDAPWCEFDAFCDFAFNDPNDKTFLLELVNKVKDLSREAPLDGAMRHSGMANALRLLCYQCQYLPEEDILAFTEEMLKRAEVENAGQGAKAKLEVVKLEQLQNALDKLLHWAPPNGWSQKWADEIVRTGWSNITHAVEAPLLLNDRDALHLVYDEYTKEHPEDAWCEHITPDLFPAPKPDGKKMRFFDPLHWYAAGDHKEPGRLLSGLNRSVVEFMGARTRKLQKEFGLI